MDRYDIIAMGADELTRRALQQVVEPERIYHAVGPGDAAQQLEVNPRAVAAYAVGVWGQLVTHKDIQPFHTLLGRDRQGWVVVPDMDRVDEASAYDDPYFLYYQLMERWGRRRREDGTPYLTGAINLAFETARNVLRDSIEGRTP